MDGPHRAVPPTVFCAASTIVDDADRAFWYDRLSPAERERHDQLRRAADRQVFIVAHALLRIAAAHVGYAADVNADIAVEYLQSGRLVVPSAASGARLEVSLSHTRGFAACAVASNAIGVDIEFVDRDIDSEGLAAHYFAPDEQDDMRAEMTAYSRRLHFTRLWILKESYLKAKGLGLSVPLDAPVFRFEPSGEIRARFGPPLQDDTRDWSFAIQSPSDGHLMGIAWRRTDGVLPAIDVFRCESLNRPSGCPLLSTLPTRPSQPWTAPLADIYAADSKLGV